MNDPYPVSRKLLPLSSTTTDISAVPPPQGTAKKLRCRFGTPGTSALQDASQVVPLLRYRLRVVTFITTVFFSLFLALSFLKQSEPDGPTNGDLAIHSLVVAVMLLVCCALWTTYPLSILVLRVMELAVFGAAAAYFVYGYLIHFSSGEVAEWAAPAHVSGVVALASMSYNMRWFVLIVLYGAFVPNTWKRCATVVGTMAVFPLFLSMWSCTFCVHMADKATGLQFMGSAILLGLAALIAIFGSYKINVLQREAVVARELGQYRLRQKLGSGGMGEVYLAEHMLLRRQCALKLIRPDQTADATNLERFEREVQAMAALTHWNTVEVYDYGRADDGTFYYVMEYLPGLSLQDLVEKFGPLPPERAVHFLRQVCSALQEAHALPLIHRDIKPSNVIAAQRGGIHDVAKLLDFGLVQCLGSQVDAHKLTVQGVILGSPPYMAPEQSLGRSNLDARTDIYSVGALAYFLLTGQPPFIRETAMELLVAHAHEKPTPISELRPEVPADLQAIVMRCLEKEPGRRFQDAESLENSLAQCGVSDLWTRQSAARWWEESAGNARDSGLRLLVG
jgi:tRNA A-37 threonylcarbamoyl transferase component Bud32